MSVLRTNLVQNITGSNLSLTAGGSNSTISLSSSSTSVTLTGGAVTGLTAVTVDNIRLGTSAVNEIDTSSGNLVLDSAGGTVDVQDNLSVAGNFSVSGTFTNYVIGTNIQAYDAGLTSIAGLTTAANKFVYTTGSDVYALADITAFGRSILDDADGPAVCTTIGAVKTTDVISVAKGGTGLTSLGTALHVLRVNAGGNALEFAAVTSGGGSVSQSDVDSTAITFAIALGG